MKSVVLIAVLVLVLVSSVQAEIEIKDMTPRLPVLQLDLTVEANFMVQFTTDRIAKVTFTKPDINRMVNAYVDMIRKAQEDQKNANASKKAPVPPEVKVVPKLNGPEKKSK